MATSDQPPRSNEGAALAADVTPEMDKFHQDWARTDMLNRGFDPQMVAELFGGPPAYSTGSDPPQIGPDLDAARAAAGASPPAAIGRNEEGPDLGKARAAAGVGAGGGESDPTAHDSYLGRVKDIPGDVYSEFKSAIGEMEDISKESDTSTVGGRVKGGLKMTGALSKAAFSPLTGAAKSMVARPLAERMDVERTDKPMTPEEMEAARKSKSAAGFGELMRRATPHYDVTTHESEPASEEKVQNFTDKMEFVLPGTGLISYGALARGALASQSAQRIARIISPGVQGEPARALLRQAGGMAARDTEVTRVELDQHQRALQGLSDGQRLAFMDAVEGGPTTIRAIGSAPLRNLATEIRRQMQIREGHLRQLPSAAGATYVENYFPHMWQDPNRATQVFGAGGPGRTGSAASMRARSIPTIMDGIRQGLVPVTYDPLELVMRYVQSVDRFIYFEAARDAAVRNRTAVWVRPHAVGASGHPMGYNVPQGWTKLAGRGSTRADGAQLFAPTDFATVWNRGLSPGFTGPMSQPIVQSIHQASNFVTMAELGLSAYHAFTMAHESMVSEVASAIQNAIGGGRNRDWRQFFRGVGQAATAATILGPAAKGLYRGRQFERAYLGLSPGSPDMNRMINRLERAGGRATGTRHAQIESSQYQSYWQAFRRGALRAAVSADVQGGHILRMVARTMDSISHPIFNYAIPKLKNAAFMREAEAWVANHPNVSQAELDRGMRMVWDSIDNRFGEMVQDNIFWDRRLKQAAQIMMRSYSWNLGTIREIGGGAMDLARGRSPLDSTRVAYVLALPIAYATLNAMYQYMMTGEGPQDMQDLIAPRTGGTAQGSAVPSLRPFGRSQRNEVPERAQLPGYAKDIFGWWFDPAQEAINKIATGPRSVGQLATNRDWQDLPIFNPNDSVPGWLKQFAKYAAETYGPISVRQLAQGQKEGSNIGTGQTMMGIRPASSYLQDKESYDKAKRRRSTLDWKKKQNIERRRQQQYGGTNEE